jgi:O-antigen/teichoic acid export membrane protein
MSRVRAFARSLLSGYLTIGGNIVYTFASVPLALHYLSTAEFGLWALTMQISGYIALIDMGMGGSVSRLLIDHKDDKATGEYGGIIKTGTLVGAVQGLGILLIGSVLALTIGDLLKVPRDLRPEFIWLVIGQSAFLGLSFVTRIFYQMLVAHQRYDIANYAQAAVFLISLVAMWIGFAAGFGVYSLLASQAIGAIIVSTVNFIGIQRLNLLPPADQWGRASAQKFKELFNYGGGLFLYLLGSQMISASQIILISRSVGLEAAATWSVCARLYTMFTMLIWRAHEYAGPPLAEMFVRGERDRMRDRMRDVTFLTTNVAIVAALFLAICNHPFVHVWTHGRTQWNPVNDLLLGVWLVLTTAMRAHVNLAGATKRFEWLPHMAVLEGSVFIGVNILLARVDGFTRILAISILCTCAFTLPYALLRTRRFFGLTWRQIVAWHQTSWQMAWRLTLVGLLIWFGTRNLEPLPRVALNALAGSIAGGLILVRYGFGKSLRGDLAGKLPPAVRRFVSWAG